MNLATIAVNESKPRKDEAQQILRELAEKYPDSAHDFGKLYVYFMPPKPKTPKTGFQWVATAIATRDIRENLTYVHVTAEHIEATDGHRLHRMPNADGLRPGYYLPNGDKAHEPDFAKFPNTDRIMPSRTGNRVTVVLSDLGVVEPYPKHVAYVVSTPTGDVLLNKQYLDQAAVGVNTFNIIYGEDAEVSPVRIDMDDRTAVIMPIRPPNS